MSPIARVLLDTAATLIALGGLYDLAAPRLPANLAAICAGNENAGRLTRELLRALGGALLAIGVAVLVLTETATPSSLRKDLTLIALLVVPSEGINAFAMRRVGSPFYIPCAFIALTLIGILLAWNLH